MNKNAAAGPRLPAGGKGTEMEAQTYPTAADGRKEIQPAAPAHSPLPWSLSAGDGGHTIVSPVLGVDAAGTPTGEVRGICVMFHRGEDESRANAELIVRAANVHADLVSACRAMLPYLPDQAQLLDYAATNDGRASGYDVAAMKIREALRRCES
jgi:hypothetical protein